MWSDLDVTLTGTHVVLEPLAQRHVEGLRAAAADPRVFAWMSRKLHDASEFDVWLAETWSARDAGREAPFATVARADGRVLGSTRYMELRPDDRGLEIGWTWLMPSVWQTGVNIEAKLLMLRHAFETLGCIRVELQTDARNERSRAAIAALPAQFEGVRRAHRVLPDGTLRDSAYYSVLDREWPDVHANLQRRLAAIGLSS